MESRFGEVSATFETLKLSEELFQSVDLSLATEIYSAFFESKWTYGCFYMPMTTLLSKTLDGMHAGFKFATLTTVTKKSRRNTLAFRRALLRLDFPDLVRKIRTH